MPNDTVGDEFAISFKTTQENHILNRELKDPKDKKDIFQSLAGNQVIARISSSNSKTYICQWCRILHNRIVCYQTSDFLEKYTVHKHVGWTAYPGPADLEKV